TKFVKRIGCQQGAIVLLGVIFLFLFRVGFGLHTNILIVLFFLFLTLLLLRLAIFLRQHALELAHARLQFIDKAHAVVISHYSSPVCVIGTRHFASQGAWMPINIAQVN